MVCMCVVNFVCVNSLKDRNDFVLGIKSHTSQRPLLRFEGLVVMMLVKKKQINKKIQVRESGGKKNEYIIFHFSDPRLVVFFFFLG